VNSYKQHKDGGDKTSHFKKKSISTEGEEAFVKKGGSKIRDLNPSLF